MATPQASKPGHTDRHGGLNFGRETFGRVQEWSVEHRRMEYAGEVLVAESVDPRWLQPLSGRPSFRVVFTTLARRVAPRRILDPAIVVAVPRQSDLPPWERLARELNAIRETMAEYTTSRGRGEGAVLHSMRERVRAVQGEMARLYRNAYAEGHVYAAPGIGIAPGDVFAEGSPEDWANRLASSALAQAHPSPPVDWDRLPGTLTASEVGALFRGLFQRDPDAQEQVRGLGPPLGLTRQRTPLGMDISRSRVVRIIEAELDSRRGKMAARELLETLVHGRGLPWPLALLYTLAYVRAARAEVEVLGERTVATREGGPLALDRITWDLVPELEFSESLADALGTIRRQASRTWNAALPYASLVVGDLKPARDPEEVAGQERRLADGLEALGRRLARADATLGTLSAREGEGGSGDAGALVGLQTLCASAGFETFLDAARQGFDGPGDVERALDLLGRVERLEALVPAVTAARLYLAEMSLGPSHGELGLEADLLATQLTLGNLLANPDVWRSAEERLRMLRSRHEQAYRAHHAAYHRDAAGLRGDLRGLRSRVEAVSRLGAVPELGSPAGLGLPERLATLAASLRACREEAPSLEEAPCCQGCLLPLGEDTPRAEVAALAADTDAALEQYSRRLRAEARRRILSHQDRAALDKFINLVQVSDLSSLAEVVNSDDVIEFLRVFVGGAAARPPRREDRAP